MDFKITEDSLPSWYCPLFKRTIDAGLCYEIVNAGGDQLRLSPAEQPPCDWTTAHNTCKQHCTHYTDWD